MANSRTKTQNKQFIDMVLRYYTAICVVLIFGIIGSWFIYASQASSITINLAAEKDQVSRINYTRTVSNNLNGYMDVECLNKIAEKQAKYIATQGKLSHNPNMASDVSSYCGGWQAVGENVGYGPSSSAIYTAFRNSPLHNANIIDSTYTRVGVGAYSDSSGRIWVAQEFAKCVTCSSTNWQTRTIY
jgi:uncharacterized protein YkwD